ncbi:MULTISPECIES: hypothetical protein [unclassified Mycobacterium]|uniref:hypothetical protein n=1 Tax=unclassified Mycobacterium TaxID=2642494 RepID=UPI0011503033|nr:hypothetical protein [Mycobacterium sp. ST-F2]
MDKRAVIVFDGDDTLWATEALYERSRAHVRALLHTFGMAADLWDSTERTLDLQRVEQHGFAWYRFPSSCALAVLSSQEHFNRIARLAASSMAFALACCVFLMRAEVSSDAESVLQQLGKRCELVLLTKGQPWVQRRRLRQSRLRRYFARVMFVPSKSVETFVAAAGPLRQNVQCVSVGNSLRSDIEPSIAAGLRGIHLDGPMWDFERRECSIQLDGVVSVQRLAELPNHIDELLNIDANVVR